MISEEKQRLRSRMRSLVATAPAVSAGAVLAAWEVWRTAERVCAYVAIGAEPVVLNPWPLRKTVALPRVVGEELSLHLVEAGDELHRGAFGIREPAENSPASGNSFDLILVPGLAFDRQGGRLGRGRGFYDRFLATATGRRVGVCQDFQIVDSVPCEAHDLTMDFVITPTEIIASGSGG